MANTAVERLTSTNAIVGGAIALLAFASQIKDILKPVTDLLPEGVRPFVFPALLIIAAALILRAFLFARPKRSRLVRPDALRLQRDNRQHLVGRQDEIARVIDLATRGPLLFVVGESGVGKSALLGAGVAPKLAGGGSLLPIYIDSLAGPDWDEDAWRLLFLGIQRAMPPGQKADLGLAGLPAPAKRKPLLASLQAATARTPLIIIDQFDDYQGRHWAKFQDNGSWVRAADILRANSFWRALAELAREGKVHLAIVTRSDTALGLESIRFVEPETFTVPRLDKAFIGELLDSIARPAAEGGAAVIEAPEAGWTELRDRLIDDLGRTGAVLPQQLKISLLGLATLPHQILSIGAYERAGGTAGLEAEWIKARIKRAESMDGLNENLTLKILLALVSPEEPTKTRDLSIDALAAEARIDPAERDAIERTLVQLEGDEVVRRRRDPAQKDDRWRLDHDYLTGVIREAERRVNAWTIRLKEGQEALAAAHGHPVRQWKALLGPAAQMRFLWDRMRGRFRYGHHRAFAALSGARFLPALLLILGTTAGFLYFQDRNERRQFAEVVTTPFDNIEGLSPLEVKSILMIQEESVRRGEDVLDRLLSSDTLIAHLDDNAQAFARAMAWQTGDATWAGPRLIAAMERYAESAEALSRLGRVAGFLGDGLSPAQTAQVARNLLAAMERRRDSPRTLLSLGIALGGLGEAVPSEVAAAGVRLIVNAIRRANPAERGGLVRVLARSGSLPPELAQEAPSQGVMLVFARQDDYDQKQRIAPALRSLSQINPQAAAALYRGLPSSFETSMEELLAMLAQRIPESQARSLRAAIEAKSATESDPTVVAGLSILMAGLEGNLHRDLQIKSIFQALADPLASDATPVLLRRLAQLATPPNRTFAREREAYRWLAAEHREHRLLSIDLGSIAAIARERATSRLAALRVQPPRVLPGRVWGRSPP